MYFHMNWHHKTIMKSQKNGHGKAQIARYFVIYKWASLKMQENIK